MSGASSQNAAAAGTPVTPAARPAARLGMSAGTASAPSRMCMSAAATPASTSDRSPPNRRIEHTGASCPWLQSFQVIVKAFHAHSSRIRSLVWPGGAGKENEESMAAALGPSRLATKLPAKAMSCVLAKKSPLGQRSHLSVPSSQVWAPVPSKSMSKTAILQWLASSSVLQTYESLCFTVWRGDTLIFIAQRKKSPLTAKHIATSESEQGMEQEAVKRQKGQIQNPTAAVTWPDADGNSSDDFE